MNLFFLHCKMAQTTQKTNVFLFQSKEQEKTGTFTKVMLPDYIIAASPILCNAHKEYKETLPGLIQVEHLGEDDDIDTITSALRCFTQKDIADKKILIPDVKEAYVVYTLGTYLFPEITWFAEVHTYVYMRLTSKLPLRNKININRRLINLEYDAQLYGYFENLTKEKLIASFCPLLRHVYVYKYCSLFEGNTLAEKLSKFHNVTLPQWYIDAVNSQPHVGLDMFLHMADVYKTTSVLRAYMHFFYLHSPATLMEPSAGIDKIINKRVFFISYPKSATPKLVHAVLSLDEKYEYLFTLGEVAVKLNTRTIKY